MNGEELPDNLRRALLAYDSPLAVIVEVDHKADVVVKSPAYLVAGFRGAMVGYRYELGRFDAGPVLALAMTIYDDPDRPFGVEIFLDVNKAADLALARKLVDQLTLTLHFYDFDLDYHFSKRIAHRQKQRRELRELIRLALEHLETVPEPDWYEALQQFMRAVTR